MNNGWLLLYRKISKKAWFSNPNYVALWMHLLVKASWKDTQLMMNGSLVTLKRGQLLTGRKALSTTSGISENIVRSILNRFEVDQQITIQKTNRYSIITVLNYDLYQGDNQPNTNQPPTEHQPATSQPPHIKEVKELKEVKEEKITAKPQAVCPYQQIVDLYHECLPNNPRVVKLTGKRKSHIKSRWRNDLQTLDQWRNYFEDVSESRFLTGQAKPNGDRKVFIADIDFLINESNLTKVAERKYHDVSR